MTDTPNIVDQDRRLATAITEGKPGGQEAPDNGSQVLAEPRRSLLGNTKLLGNVALVLENGGDVEVHDIDGPTVRARSGRYIPHPSKRFWLNEGIGPGYVTVFFEGDPTPATDKKPTGFYSTHLAHLLGGELSHLVLGAFDGPDEGFKMKTWMKWVAVSVGVLVIAGVFVYFYVQKAKTGTVGR